VIHDAPADRPQAAPSSAGGRVPGQRSARLPRDERRAQLLKAAQEVFVANGYHGAAMDEIAETAHVSKPVLYQHFPSKRELYLALLDNHLSALTDLMMGALNSTSDNKERVQAVMRAYYRFIDSEVIPAIEGKYKCASFKALCIDEGSPFGNYILGSQARGFNAYLSLTPFIWFNSGRRPESAKAFFAYYAGFSDGGASIVIAGEDNNTDELYLKTGKAGWVQQ